MLKLTDRKSWPDSARTNGVCTEPENIVPPSPDIRSMSAPMITSRWFTENNIDPRSSITLKLLARHSKRSLPAKMRKIKININCDCFNYKTLRALYVYVFCKTKSVEIFLLILSKFKNLIFSPKNIKLSRKPLSFLVESVKFLLDSITIG